VLSLVCDSGGYGCGVGNGGDGDGDRNGRGLDCASNGSATVLGAGGGVVVRCLSLYFLPRQTTLVANKNSRSAVADLSKKNLIYTS
jgi:hypothetical protein